MHADIDICDRAAIADGVDPDGRGPAARVQTARVLIESTALSFADLAVAAGFADGRQCEEAVLAAYGMTGAALRDRGRTARGPATLTLRLTVRTPFAFAGVLGHLAACAVPGCEEVRDGAFRRTMRLPHGAAVVTLMPTVDHVRCTLSVQDVRDVSTAITRCRRLLDLDTDPQQSLAALCADPVLAPVVTRSPGQRIPGTVDPDELAVRVVLSQQVSLKAARTHAHRLLLRHGEPLPQPDGGLTHLFPSVQQLAELDPAQLALPTARRRTLVRLIAALADGEIVLGPQSDWARTRHQLLQLPGIGPWTAELIAMRALGDPDAFPATDLGVRNAARSIGLPDTARALQRRAEPWRPWRSYATQYLWTTLDHDVNNWPPTTAITETT